MLQINAVNIFHFLEKGSYLKSLLSIKHEGCFAAFSPLCRLQLDPLIFGPKNPRFNRGSIPLESEKFFNLEGIAKKLVEQNFEG